MWRSVTVSASLLPGFITIGQHLAAAPKHVMVVYQMCSGRHHRDGLVTWWTLGQITGVNVANGTVQLKPVLLLMHWVVAADSPWPFMVSDTLRQLASTTCAGEQQMLLSLQSNILGHGVSW